MLVRIILFLGIGLILFAGGAAGWQYWQQMQGAAPVAVAEAAPVRTGPFAAMISAPPPQDLAVPDQNWLISPGGGLVERRDVDAVLRQGSFVESRRAHLFLRLPLTALLEIGERLPDPVFAGVFADIRAPVLSLDLCAALLEGWASGCQVAEAGAAKDSYDPASGTAAFYIAMDFTQKVADQPLPDLASHTLNSDWVHADLGGTETPKAALAELVLMAAEACASYPAESGCRITDLTMEWEAGQASARAKINWFAPLPKGVFAAPPLF